MDDKDLVNNFINAITDVVGPSKAGLHEPSFNGNEIKYLKECIKSTYVSSIGKFVDRFESNLADYTGAKHAIAVVNGTAALHIALKLGGVKENEEVLMPALTFVATANAVSYCNAIPHFVDSELKTLGIDVHKLHAYLLNNTKQRAGKCINTSTGRVISALVPMHTFGHPSNIDGLLSLADEFNLILIEDAAESLGSTYKGNHTGTLGLMGTLSFNGNKTITTGGGGAILTNDSNLANQVKHIITTAKVPHSWKFIHDQVGYNYRMPNINAALGCAQLEQLDTKINSKRKMFLRYQEAFLGIKRVKVISEPDECKSNYWLQTILLDSDISDYRDLILKGTNSAGFMTRPAWNLMHELKPFINCPRMNLDFAESLSRRLINIPSST